MNFDVFISYSSKDAATANAACAALEAANIRCWIAPRDIVPGARWGASIVRAINQCRVMVLIFSGNANGSTQVYREVDQAFSNGKAVVPLRVENVTPSDELAYYLNTVHWLDALTPPLERGLQQLTTVVQALLTTVEPGSALVETTVDDAEAARAEEEARAEDERRVQKVEAKRPAEEEDRQKEQKRQPQEEVKTRRRIEAERDAQEADAEQREAEASGFAAKRQNTISAVDASIAAHPESHLARAEDERRERGVRFWRFAITAPLIYAGSIIFTGWLVSASTGPSGFSWAQWLTNSISGALLLVCYGAALIVQSLSSINGLLVRMRSDPSAHGLLRYDDIGALATLPVVAGMALFVVKIFGGSHAVTTAVINFPQFSVTLLLFILVSAVQEIYGMHSVIDRTLKSSRARYFTKIANIICVIAVAVTAIVSLAGIRSNYY